MPSTRSATRSAVLLYCSILWTPSAKRSIFGSNDEDRPSRCDWSAAGVVNLNVKDDVGSEEDSAGGVICDCWRVANIEACSGSRSEASMSAKV